MDDANPTTPLPFAASGGAEANGDPGGAGPEAVGLPVTAATMAGLAVPSRPTSDSPTVNRARWPS